MEIGYILAVVFAVIWLGFKAFEIVQRSKAKNTAEKEIINADER